MSEVVRMLEGDGLAERWEDQIEGILQELDTTYNPNTIWISSDSSYEPSP